MAKPPAVDHDIDADALVLVDALIYVFRAWFSLPASMTAADGRPINAVHGYTRFLLNLLTTLKPCHISCAFDESLTTCFRNRIYPDYKANRESADADFQWQIDCCARMTQLLGLHRLALADYEADDIIGTLAARHGQGRQVVIVTRDKDLGQLLGERDRIFDAADNMLLTPADMERKLGVRIRQIPDLLALAGDTVDNIPGLSGIGVGTARKLLEHFRDIDDLFDNLPRLDELGLRGAARLRGLLDGQREQAELFRSITRIETAVPLQVSADELLPAAPDRPGLAALCDELGFGTGMREAIDEYCRGRS